jgi:hypothetical protein
MELLYICCDSHNFNNFAFTVLIVLIKKVGIMITTHRGHDELGVKAAVDYSKKITPVDMSKKPTYTSWSEDKKLVIPAKNDDDKSFMMRYTKNTLIITVCEQKIIFQKNNTSRGKTFLDSREPKKRFTEEETLSELQRLLGSYEGALAMRELKWS